MASVVGRAGHLCHLVPCSLFGTLCAHVHWCTRTDTRHERVRCGEKDERLAYKQRCANAHVMSPGGFLEHAEVHGNLYGTSRKSLQEVVEQGRMPILDVDVQGLLLTAMRELGRRV